MPMSVYRRRVFPALTSLSLIAAGCGEAAKEDQPKDAAAIASAEPAPASAPAVAAETSGKSPSVKQIMGKLTKGPKALTPVLGEELKAEKPAWDLIQPQAKEFAQMAALMGQNDPPKGSRDSWMKLTSAYAESATALDKAAQAKDKDAALEAHGVLANSCKGCHGPHKAMGPGMGGPGGMRGPGGFGGPGGRPPGGGPPPQ